MDDGESRRFKRYTKETEFTIRLKNEKVRAKTVDYSLDGLCAFVESSPSLKQGDLVNLDIEDLGIHQQGKVVWVKEFPSATQIGIAKTGPLKGDLSMFNLADTLIGLQRGFMTGVLEISHGSMIKKVYIDGGDMLFADSNTDDDSIGSILVKERWITQRQHEESWEEAKKTGRPQETILIQKGILKPTELIDSIRKRAEHIVINLFSIRGGYFEFKAGPLPKKEAIRLNLSAANLIYRGLKTTASYEQILEECPPDCDLPIDFSKNPLNLFQDITLDAEDRKITNLVDGRSTINDLVTASGSDREAALRSIYALLNTRILEFKRSGDKPHGISPEEVFAPDIDDETGAIIEKIHDMHVSYDGLGYYGVLGIKDSATLSEVRKAYYKAAKEFHPDLHFRLPEETKGKLHEIFSYITTAYNTLSHPQQREEYDRVVKNTTQRTVSKQDMARERFESGRLSLRRGAIEEAMQFFAEATYLDGEESKYHFFYGLSLSRLKRAKEAERALGRAQKADPNNPDILSELGHVHMMLGFQNRAKRDFEKALEINPNHKRALDGLNLLQPEANA